MSFSIYEATLPPMMRLLHNLGAILDKAKSQAAAKGLALEDLVEARLAPDMHPFKRQIQIASDAAKGCAARLSGSEAPSFPDSEQTFDELRQRITKTLDYLKSFKPAQFDGAEDRHIVINTPHRNFEMNGRDFATSYALPNFFFHVTTAYGLLRHKGIDIGKADYLGGN